MQVRLATRFTLVVFLAAFGLVARAQQTAPPNPEIPPDGWGRPLNELVKNQAPPSAPRHDISGTWYPTNGLGDGIQANGAKNMPSDTKPEHELPFTLARLQAFNRSKPWFGVRMAPPEQINDRLISVIHKVCRVRILYEVRATQFLQTPYSVIILYEYGKIWRTIWTDGRPLPNDPEPRWFGYSVGQWVDDNTLVVQTIGTDERTWVDNAGCRPTMTSGR
jgi:hypothetical protein